MFSIPCVGATHEGPAIVFNACLLRLMHLRKPQIAAPVGDNNKSRTLWKLANFQQGSLYRVVMLGQGGSNGWNDGNQLSSILCGRAFLETVAKMHYLNLNLAEHRGATTIEPISTFLDKELFSTRNDEWLAAGAGFKATNILTMMEKLDKDMPGVKQHYDFLSEWCHPNWPGQSFLFATNDNANRVTTFSESKGRNNNVLDVIFGALMTITYFERMISELDSAITTLSNSKVEGATTT
jgi:hypothetical protein